MSSTGRLGIGRGEEDRISDLPDEVIAHILSFIDTNHAIRLSTLSKRWINLWCRVPSLSFNIGPSDARIVSEILSLINNRLQAIPPPLTRRRCLIRKFSLNCSSFNVVSDYLNCVLTAGVQHLSLELPYSFSLFEKLRGEVFACETLVDLKLVERGGDPLGLSGGGHCLQVPDDLVNLPNLKTLHLCVSTITSDASKKLLASCPNLESLTIVASSFLTDPVEKLLVFKIRALKLRHLVLAGYNVKSNFDRTFLISTPLLETFHISGMLGIYIFRNSSSSSLVEASIDLLQEKCSLRLTGANLLHILKEISGVESLKIMLSLSKALDHCIRSGSICFPNLTQLELKGIHCLRVLKLLKFMPNLKKLKLSDHGKLLDNELSDNVAPDCLMSHMKVLEIEESRKWRSRLRLMEYLLKNGYVLDKIIIDCIAIPCCEDLDSSYEDQVHGDEMRSFMGEILKFYRGSETCEIVFLCRCKESPDN